jgi:hypothetical protein
LLRFLSRRIERRLRAAAADNRQGDAAGQQEQANNNSNRVLSDACGRFAAARHGLRKVR